MRVMQTDLIHSGSIRCEKKADMTAARGQLFPPCVLRAPDGGEFFETLAEGKNCRVERIVSSGQTTPEGQWYDQERDEWVVLLQGRARLAWEDGTQTDLSAGEWLTIPAHARHRVVYTSAEPMCVWLALHFDGK